MMHWNVQIMALIQYEQTSLMGHCIVIRFVSEMTLTNLRSVFGALLTRIWSHDAHSLAVLFSFHRILTGFAMMANKK